MTEREYINATDLSKVRCIMGIIREIVAENSIIDNEEYLFVTRTIYQWQRNLEMQQVKTD